MKSHNLRTLCRVAILIALEIVLTRFASFNTPTLRIGFGFAPIALCGIIYGAPIAATAAGISDVLGAIIFPIGGGIYPPITLTAILTGAVFGLFLHRKNAKFFPNVVLCAICTCFGLSLGLNSYWLSLLTGTPYVALLATRIIQAAFMFTVQLVMLPLLQKLSKTIYRH